MIILFIGTQEILIIALVILLLFGGAKIPELMRGMGKGVKSFKEGLNDLSEPASGDNKQNTKQESTKANPDNGQQTKEQ